MIYKIVLLSALYLASFVTKDAGVDQTVTASVNTEVTFEMEAKSVYEELHSTNLAKPQLASFTKALKGFYELKAAGVITKDMLTIVDFSMSSNKKRLWIIDMSTKTILYNSLVAHGRNTGEEFAKNFSNAAESYKSSLGFYVTGEVYNGKHGMSMKLDGLEKGINDNARNRAVVMHGADYVSDSFIKNHNRLGRSLGCPAIPVALTKKIINTIKDRSCLFIYHPSGDRNKPARHIS